MNLLKLALSTILITMLITIVAVGQEQYRQSTSKVFSSRKPVIDKKAIKTWTIVRDGKISNNGNYVFYKIKGYYQTQPTLVIFSTKDRREFKITGRPGSDGQFSDDGQRFVFLNGDSLGLLKLDNFSLTYIAGVKGYDLVKYKKSEWLFYTKKGDDSLVILNSNYKFELGLPKVEKYWINQNGNNLWYLSSSKDANNEQSLSSVELTSKKQTVIWRGSDFENLVISSDGAQVAFNTQGNAPSIWISDHTGRNPEKVLDANSDALDSYKISKLTGFSFDGKRLFLNVKNKNEAQPLPGVAMVDVWSYHDVKLRSVQSGELDSKDYLSSLNLKSRALTILQHDDESINIRFNTPYDTSGFIINRSGDRTERHWNRQDRGSVCSVNTVTGLRDTIPLFDFGFSSSPSGKYFIGYDASLSDLFVYNKAKRKTINITSSLHIPFRDSLDNEQLSKRNLTLAGWLEGDSGVLVYDRFDIWLCDPHGNLPTLCITQGYGRKHNLTLRISGRVGGEYRVLKRQDVLILNAFDHETKDNGFFKVRLNNPHSFEKLILGPYAFDTPNDLGIEGEPPIKARDKNIYLLRRSDAKTSPNYFLTENFKSFIPVSNNYPEKEYNWEYTKLISFNTAAGDTLKGVLHFPEDFDSTKKYPVIIYYYESRSDELNRFQHPDFTQRALNISWFVSRGYLVFTPDIKFRLGYPGRSALAAVEGAASKLSELGFVDPNHIGLQGHSFSGFETNYIITHSHRFAAAVSGSGSSNLISHYNSIPDLHSESKQVFLEQGQYRVGYTLWERPGLYLGNSPILKADFVITPLLLMNNKLDFRVPFTQGLEMYLGLRRLGKKVWLLQYDNEGHHVLGDETSEDYTNRITQFFDHYLKGMPAPVWMTRGIELKDKGVRTGFEYDTEIKTPGAGLLTPEEQKKLEEYSKIPLEEKLKRIGKDEPK